MKTLTTTQKLKTAVYIFLTTLTMALLITACTSSGYDSGGSSSNGGDSGTGCQAGYCLSNGACCPTSHPYWCGGTCYATFGQMNGAGCTTVQSQGC